MRLHRHIRSKIFRLFGKDEAPLPLPLMQMPCNPFVFAIFNQTCNQFSTWIIIFIFDIIIILKILNYRWFGQ
ncbi:hypothetical protein D3C73_1654230 [compost metagenome]